MSVCCIGILLHHAFRTAVVLRQVLPRQLPFDCAHFIGLFCLSSFEAGQHVKEP